MSPEDHENKQRIRKENPFCDAAPELYEAIPIEEAKQDPRYKHFFKPEDDWRLPDGNDKNEFS